MKTMRKRGLYAVALLALAALAIGCQMQPPGGYTPPAGMGAVKLNFSHIARMTILPKEYEIEDFSAFELQFIPVTGGLAKTEIRGNSTAAERNASIDLVPGTYNLDVIAYMNGTFGSTIDPPTDEAATWSSDPLSPLSITSGGTTLVTVILEPYDPAVATGNGKFGWDITNEISDDITLATMTVKTLSGVPISTTGLVPVWVNPIVLVDNTAATPPFPPSPSWTNAGVTIPSNYYYVDIEVKVATSLDSKKFRHVLHVYQGMDSIFTYTFKDGHMGIGVNTGTVTPTITYKHPEDNPPEVAVTPAAGTLKAGNGSVDTPYLLSLDPASTLTSVLTVSVTNSATFTGGVVFQYHDGTNWVNGTAINSSAAPFDKVGTTQISVVGNIECIVCTPTHNIPYHEEIFIKVVDPVTGTWSLGDAPGGGALGYYNPPGLSMESFTDGLTTNIVLSGSSPDPITNISANFHSDLTTVHDPLYLKPGTPGDPNDPGMWNGFTYMVISNLYPVGNGLELRRWLHSESLNLYIGGTWTGYGTPEVVQSMINPTGSTDPDFAFILWNGATKRVITFEVQVDGGPITTYVIDWSNVTILP
jgi:hypothetical protein